ncbi:MAG: hypothetical protein FWC98_02505, partial [Bacteroidales bacterium]|nr:hypothetical protein [Bacteroidales bacterium]
YTSGAGETISIVVSNLAPGYVYRVDITGVSDQISRKSFTGQAAFIEPATPVFATFAVIPTPTATPIDFVGNQEAASAATPDPAPSTPIFP